MNALIGRSQELSRLAALLAEAQAGEQRVALVCGDPGIGKTSLVETLCSGAGLRTAWGRCWEGGGAPPYWPWLQVLRACLAEAGDEVVARLGPRATDLAPLLPELAAAEGEGATPAADTIAARIPMFEAVAELLEIVAANGGLIVALDDLHAADEGSLQVLRHVARDPRPAALFVVGTYREAEVAASPAHQVALGAVARHGTTIRLGGLATNEVAALLEPTGTVADDKLVRQVHQATDGNPFLVYEASRTLTLQAGSDVELPMAAQGLIRQRADLLAGNDRDVLAAAAVLGREFSVGELGRLLERPPDALLDSVSRAEAARVVDEAGLGRWSFSHSLLREALLADLPDAERTRLHRRAGETLVDVSRVAYHFSRAGDSRALDACAAAGRQALAALAFEDAARWYEGALATLTGDGQESTRRRYDLHMAIGHALLMTDVRRARDAYCEAIQAARAMGRVDLAAEAVIEIAPAAASDTTLIGALDEALCELPEDDSPLRAKTLVTFARLLNNSTFDRASLAQISRAGLEMARRVGDPETLWTCLWQWHQNAFMDMYTLDERLAVAEELVALAPHTGNRRHIPMARTWRLANLLEAGDMDGVRAEAEVARREAENLREPFFMWVVPQYLAQVALHEGLLDEADRLAQEAVAAGRRAEWQPAEGSYRQHRWMLLRHRGEFEQLEREARAELRTWYMGSYSYFHHVLILALTGLGRDAEARQYLHDALSRGIEVAARITVGENGLPHLARTVVDAAGLAETFWQLGDAEHARILYDALLPHAHRQVPSGEGGVVGTCTRHLGQLAALLGRYDEADVHFRTAHELHERYGAGLYGVIGRIDHARMLLARDGPGDRTRARELLATARQACDALRLAYYGRQAAELIARASAPPAGRPRFVQEGEYWTVEFGGSTVRVPDSRGVRYLAQLTAAPGKDVHALDLVGAKPSLRRAAAGSDGGAALDSAAKAAYRRRLHELARHEPGEEAALLVSELNRAVGLGGRDRRTASDPERARQSVTRALKSAVDRLAEANPALGEHLRATVRTGTYCGYSG